MFRFAQHRSWKTPLLTLLALATVLCSRPSPADESATNVDSKPYQAMVDRGIQALLKAQDADGAFSKQMGIGVTALAIEALLRNGRTPDDPAVAKALKLLENSLRDDGAIAPTKSRIPNYETCLAISTLSSANQDGRYNELLKKAEKFVKGVQFDEAEDKQTNDLSYGGSGYGRGGSGRPDLSNTAFLIDALHDLGRDGNDEAIQKALVFVSRCQNLESQYNTTKLAAEGNQDGGFFYTVAEGAGSSPAGQIDQGGLRSYGTMTYAGLKSMIYAGVTKDDIRVKAALGWLKKNYTLKENPPLGSDGLYYYYHTLAKCLSAMGEPLFEDSHGVRHDWRKEIVEELAKRQKENGTWVNTNRKWMETDPNLVTAYSLIVLSYCRPQMN
ncbi:MAG: terpene cyclase/mutase family protein [Pirellulales bacterium]|nr:terpene cyclase/mutase family protein [Pirellulales bacterium]